MTSRPTYPFDVRSADVWRIALPASVAFITEPMVGVVDIAIVGRLGDAALLGGLVLGALVFDFIFSLAYFLRLGTAGLTAQSVGARQPNEGLIHAARAIALGIGIGLVLIALSGVLYAIAIFVLKPEPGVEAALATYFHVRLLSAPFSLVNYALLGWFYGRAAARTGMMLQLLIHGVNIVLSVAFVYGLGWGVAGVAAGAVIAHAAAALVGLYLVARHFGGFRATCARIVPSELLDRVALRRMFSLSRDLMIRSAALMSVYVYFAAQGSRAGEVTLAGNAILLNMMMVSAFFLDGLAQASEQLCGKAVGANWQPAFEKAKNLSLLAGTGISAALALVLYFAGPLIIDLMTTSEPVRETARQYLWLAALAAMTGMPAFVFDGILTGSTLNDAMRNGMVVSLVFFLVIAYLLEQAFGNAGLWAAMNLFFLARAAIYWWSLERRKPALFAA